MPLPVSESINQSPLTQADSPATLFTGPCQMLGIFCSSTSSGTITVADGSTTKVAVFSPAAATFYPLPGRFATSLKITIGGTCAITVFWDI